MSSRAHPERLVVVVGLPRSGTTLLTALLDAHPNVGLYYEPRNAFPNKPVLEIPSDLPAFCEAMRGRFGSELDPEAIVTGFKETTIRPECTAWAEAVADGLAKSVSVHVVWIHRNLVHCYLSRIDGAKRYWGHHDARVSAESFRAFLEQNEASLERLLRLTRRHDGIAVRYEALTRSPERVLPAVMEHLGLDFREEQLDYHRAGAQPDKVMGDPGLRESPQPISASAIARRDEEARVSAGLLAGPFAEPRFERLRAIVGGLERGSDVGRPAEG